MAKSVQIELSYTKTNDEPIDLNLDQIQVEEQETEWTNLNNKVMRIPLMVEHLTGSQCGDLLFPSVLVTPD